MGEERLYDEIMDIIQHIAGDGVTVEKDKQLIEELDFESIQIVELIIQIEEKYHIEISSFDGFIEAFTSADSIINYLIEVIADEKYDKV